LVQLSFSQIVFGNNNVPCDNLHLLLDQMRKTVITDHKSTVFEILEDPPPQLVHVYQALKISWPKKFSHRASL